LTGTPLNEGANYQINVTAIDEYGLNVTSLLEIQVVRNKPPYIVDSSIKLEYVVVAGQNFQI
jgi:hypothetical protein